MAFDLETLGDQAETVINHFKQKRRFLRIGVKQCGGVANQCTGRPVKSDLWINNFSFLFFFSISMSQKFHGISLH